MKRGTLNRWKLYTLCLGIAFLLDNTFRSSGDIVIDRPIATGGCQNTGNRMDPTSRQRQVLGRTDQHGSWTGNVWIPPQGWKYYSTNELRAFYQGRSILWIGDSTGRRAAMSMYGILNSTTTNNNNNRTTGQHHVPLQDIDHARIIDINKPEMAKEPCHQWTNSTLSLEICRPMPGHHPSGNDGRFLFVHLDCLSNLDTLIEEELSGFSNMTMNIDLIIISLGIHDVIRDAACRPAYRSLRTAQNDTIQLLDKLQSSKQQTTIVWRTSGYVDHDAHIHTNIITKMNAQAMDQIEEIALQHANKGSNTIPNLTYVDWGGAILPRSFGAERIKGDQPAHYGAIPRQVLIQMLTNHVSSRSL